MRPAEHRFRSASSAKSALFRSRRETPKTLGAAVGCGGSGALVAHPPADGRQTTPISPETLAAGRGRLSITRRPACDKRPRVAPKTLEDVCWAVHAPDVAQRVADLADGG